MRGVILAVAILVLCAAVSYSFEDLTGLITKNEIVPTSIDIISPVESAQGIPQIKVGNPVTIYIYPGTYGAKKQLSVHSENGLRKGTTNWCSASQGECLSGRCVESYKCYGAKTINYQTSTSLSKGIYYVRLYDYMLRDYVTATFELI